MAELQGDVTEEERGALSRMRAFVEFIDSSEEPYDYPCGRWQMHEDDQMLVRLALRQNPEVVTDKMAGE